MMANKKERTTEERNFPTQISHLSYFSNGKWLPLPKWACYYLELGAALSSYANQGCRFVVAITVPVRSFASSLIATGIIASRVDLPSHNLQPHILKIQSLPIGAQVIVRTSNMRYYGIYKGTLSSFGKQYFIVNYQKGGEIGIAHEESYKIELSETSLPNIQSGRHLSPPSALLKHLFRTESLNRFLAESRLECVILGQQKSFQQELCDFRIGYQNKDGAASPGTIEDLVRVRGPQFHASSSSYRSYVLPSSGKYNPQFTSRLNNYVTIFDNPQGLIKWSSYFKSSNWFVVLDKTDRDFDLAVKEINTEYFQNRIEKQMKLSLPSPPAGVDLMFFETNL